MDDRDYGILDARGNWKPNKLIRYPDVFAWPPSIVAISKWVPAISFRGVLSMGFLRLWFGSFHDGSDKADDALKARRQWQRQRRKKDTE